MALINDLPKQKTASAKGLWLLDKGVLTSMAQYTELMKLLKPLNEDKENVLVEMVGNMTIDQGSPDSVPATLTDAQKQDIFDEAIEKLRALQKADEPKDAKDDSPPDKPESKKDDEDVWGMIRKFFRGQMVPEFTASGLMALIAMLFNWSNNRNDRPADEIAEGATRGVLKEAEEVAPRATKAAGRGIGWLFFQTIKWIGIGSVIGLVLIIFLGPFAVIPAILIAAVIWYAKSKVQGYPEKTRQAWITQVGEKLPAAMRIESVSFIQLADKSDADNFAKVLKRLEMELDTRNPFDDDHEERLEDYLYIVVAYITQHYGDVMMADAMIRDPSFAGFPPEIYTVANRTGGSKGFWV